MGQCRTGYVVKQGEELCAVSEERGAGSNYQRGMIYNISGGRRITEGLHQRKAVTLTTLGLFSPRRPRRRLHALSRRRQCHFP